MHHDHVRARRHHFGNVRVAQLDDALDHFAGFFFEPAFSLALADHRADLFVEILFRRFLDRAPGQTMDYGIE